VGGRGVKREGAHEGLFAGKGMKGGGEEQACRSIHASMHAAQSSPAQCNATQCSSMHGGMASCYTLSTMLTIPLPGVVHRGSRTHSAPKLDPDPYTHPPMHAPP
jgi:hypothetical protein